MMTTGRQFAIGFAIAILLPLLTYYGVGTFAHRPVHPTAAPFVPNATPEERQAQAEKLRAENDTFNEAMKHFNGYLFFTSILVGYAAILAGGLRLFPVISTGLLYGGMFTLIRGHSEYWSYIEDWERFVALLVAAILVVGIAYNRASIREPSAASKPD